MHYFDNPRGNIPTWLINWAAKVRVPLSVWVYVHWWSDLRQKWGLECFCIIYKQRELVALSRGHTNDKEFESQQHTHTKEEKVSNEPFPELWKYSTDWQSLSESSTRLQVLQNYENIQLIVSYLSLALDSSWAAPYWAKHREGATWEGLCLISVLFADGSASVPDNHADGLPWLPRVPG